MSDATAALADEEIDAHLHELREAFYLNGEWTDPNVYFDSTIAAVIARAKREAAEEIAGHLREWADAVIGETGMRSDGAILRWAADRIGADHA